MATFLTGRRIGASGKKTCPHRLQAIKKANNSQAFSSEETIAAM